MQKVIENFFDIGHDASATVIITLLIFILGYLITGVVFVISKFLQRRANRKMFINNLTSLNKTVEFQEKVLTSLLKNIDFVENKLGVYNKVDYFQLMLFHEMSYKDTFKSFFHGFENQISVCIKKPLKRKAFTKVWSILSNIEFWDKKMIDGYYEMFERYNKFGAARNKAINELRQMWEYLLLVDPNTISQIHKSYLNELALIVKKFSKTPTLKRVGPYFVNRNLVLKIRILNKKYPTLPFVKEFTDKCLEVSSEYIDMELLVRNTKQQYQIYYYTFREWSRSTKKIIKILQ